MSVVDASFDNTQDLEEHAAGPLMGGFMNYGFQCGMLWGATLAAGAEAYQRFGTGPDAEAAAVRTAQKLLQTIRARNKGEFNCLEITEMNLRGDNRAFPLKFFLKGGPVYCFRMSAGYAKEAAEAIDSTLSSEPIEAPSSPVSCASMLVKQMGGSDRHAVTAAGFAGGVGLSGGVCGALGAAIWALGMGCLEQGLAENQGELWKSEEFQSRAADMIDGFISTAGGFECAEIVSRRFQSIDDHAGFLGEGGCAEVIETLAAFR